MSKVFTAHAVSVDGYISGARTATDVLYRSGHAEGTQPATRPSDGAVHRAGWS